MRRTAAALVALALVTLPMAPVGAQGLQEEIAASISDQGWWDESGTVDAEQMDALVARTGGEIGFAHTDRAFAVDGDPTLQAAALLAQSALDELSVSDPGIRTILLVTGDGRSGASEVFSFSQVVLAMDPWDADAPVPEAFAAVVERLSDPTLAATPSAADSDTVTTTDDPGAFTMGRLILLGAIAIGAFILWNTYRLRRTTRRRVTTTDARTDTSAQLTAMSDLILDLEPRVTIANDPELKERFAAASRTYSDVREAAESATTGHEVADLRLEIADARWKLDVIDAELDGRDAPPRPHRRDNSGSAWDSTRGTGGGSH